MELLRNPKLNFWQAERKKLAPPVRALPEHDAMIEVKRMVLSKSVKRGRQGQGSRPPISRSNKATRELKIVIVNWRCIG